MTRILEVCFSDLCNFQWLQGDKSEPAAPAVPKVAEPEGRFPPQEPAAAAGQGPQGQPVIQKALKGHLNPQATVYTPKAATKVNIAQELDEVEGLFLWHNHTFQPKHF